MSLDTNALSAWAEGRLAVEAPIRAARRLVVPSIVLGEYIFGIRQSRYLSRLPPVGIASGHLTPTFAWS